MGAEDFAILVKISVSKLGPNSTKTRGLRAYFASLGPGAIAPRPRDAIYVWRPMVLVEFGPIFEPKLQTPLPPSTLPRSALFEFQATTFFLLRSSRCLGVKASLDLSQLLPRVFHKRCFQTCSGFSRSPISQAVSIGVYLFCSNWDHLVASRDEFQSPSLTRG